MYGRSNAVKTCGQGQEGFVACRLFERIGHNVLGAGVQAEFGWTEFNPKKGGPAVRKIFDLPFSHDVQHLQENPLIGEKTFLEARVVQLTALHEPPTAQ